MEWSSWNTMGAVVTDQCQLGNKMCRYELVDGLARDPVTSRPSG
jgi:hypothetical protein